MYVYTHAHTHTHTRLHIRVCTHMPVCVHACMLTPLLCQDGDTALAIARNRGHPEKHEMEALLRQHGAEEDEEDEDDKKEKEDEDYRLYLQQWSASHAEDDEKRLGVA